MKRFVLATALLLLLPSCGQRDVEDAGHAIASAAPRLANDGVIVASIEGKFLAIDPDSAIHVGVASHDGSVRLSGSVKTRATLGRFVAAARAVRGVKSIAAALSVDRSLPSTRERVSDFGVAAAVRANIAAQAGLNGLHLGVAARDGAVTLTGRLPTRELHATVVAAAKRAAGVKAVVDKISVAP